VKDALNGCTWRGTFVYGEPKGPERHHMWSTLRRIKPNATEPWMMIRDFNEMKCQHEHFSESKQSERRMSNFRNILNFCALHDIHDRLGLMTTKVRKAAMLKQESTELWLM
jgi:hypothetical protein